MTGKKGETPSNEALIAQSEPMDAERRRQLLLRISEFFQVLTFVFAASLTWRVFSDGFSRPVFKQHSATIEFRPSIAKIKSASFQVAGAWELRSEDRGFGGFSGLALVNGKFVALADNGAIVLLGRPVMARTSATILQLPKGHRSRSIRWGWDTEGLEQSADGEGWWVAFEQIHQLWLYDATFKRSLKNVRLGHRRWPYNLGVEGIVTDGEALLLFVEDRPQIGRLKGSRLTLHRVEGLQGRFSEATRLPDGRLIAIERSFTFLGFRNALVELKLSGSRYRITGRHPITAGALDNLEGLAVERRPGGRTRLWLISDDNFQRPLRTLLIAVDLRPTPKTGA